MIQREVSEEDEYMVGRHLPGTGQRKEGQQRHRMFLEHRQ